MKRYSSVVWQFFDRVLDSDDKRCIGVLCKLCNRQYKFFGNTTNLRSHLTHRHPIQWELYQNGTLDESAVRNYEEEADNSPVAAKRRRTKTFKAKNVDIYDQNTDTDNERANDNEEDDTAHLIRQMHRGSDEEWLEEDYYDTKPKKVKYMTIKREVVTPPRKTYTIKNPLKIENRRVATEIVKSRDEYSVFGEYVANKLRKFKLPRTRGNLQQLITTILWQAEYGMYDDAVSVKRVLMNSVQDSVIEHTIIQEQELPPQDDAEEQVDMEHNQSTEIQNVELIED